MFSDVKWSTQINLSLCWKNWHLNPGWSEVSLFLLTSGIHVMSQKKKKWFGALGCLIWGALYLMHYSFKISALLLHPTRDSGTFIKQLSKEQLEKAMASHSSTLAWKIPWMEEPGRLQSMGSLRVGHNWATSLSFFTFMHWRRKWQPTPLFLPGESQGRGSLVDWRLWGRTELDTTEAT